MPSPPTLARQLAQDVLVRVARDAAFAERVLHTALDRATLDARDRALVTELVYGTLRNLGWLDHCLETHTHKPLSNLPQPVLAALRLGAYQLLCMDMPAHSAVNESVGLVRRYGRMTGMVNAILRRVDQHREAKPEPTTNAELALQTHLPEWLLDQVSVYRGFAATVAWARANNERAPVALRINRTRSSLQQVREALVAQGISVEGAPLDPSRWRGRFHHRAPRRRREEASRFRGGLVHRARPRGELRRTPGCTTARPSSPRCLLRARWQSHSRRRAHAGPRLGDCHRRARRQNPLDRRERGSPGALLHPTRSPRRH